MTRGDAFRTEIVSRLRDLIESRDETVASLERRLGRSRGYLADALRGAKRLNLETVLETLDLLGVAPESFFAAVGRRYPAWEPAGAREVAEDEAGRRVVVECPCVGVSRRLESLIDALERSGAIDADTAALLRVG